MLTKIEVIGYLLRHGNWHLHSTTPNSVESFEKELAEYGYRITQTPIGAKLLRESLDQDNR